MLTFPFVEFTSCISPNAKKVDKLSKDSHSIIAILFPWFSNYC